MFGSMTFMVRPSGAPGTAGTVQAHLTARLAERRHYITALCAFALAAALLAAIGLYGIMLYDVHARCNEIAVRTALGARRPHIIAVIGRPPAAMIAGGVIAGLAGATAVARLLRPQLWGIAPIDPAILTSVSLGLLALGALACCVPVRDALTLDPAARLGSE
jgi:putative ABC transport system permease protein